MGGGTITHTDAGSPSSKRVERLAGTLSEPGCLLSGRRRGGILAELAAVEVGVEVASGQ